MTRGLCFIFGFFVVSFLLIRPAFGEELWSYPRESVIEYYSSWKLQLQNDRSLEESERDLRLEFVDRLIFQADRKYNSGSFRQFLFDSTWDMILADDMAQNQSRVSSSEFLKNLNLALHEILEPSENILAFLRAYVEFSSLKNPLPMDRFAESRSYSNSLEVQAAEPHSLESAGAFAELATQEPQDPAFQEGFLIDSRFNDLSPDLPPEDNN